MPPTHEANNPQGVSADAARPIGSETRIGGDEAKHIRKVLRMKAGDELELFDGMGRQYQAEIVEIANAEIRVKILDHQVEESVSGPLLTIASALPKGDRQKFLVEKLTELGVDELIPLSTNRSVVMPGKQHQAKFERYSIEACKQSRRNRLLKIGEPTPLDRMINNNDDTTQVLLHPDGQPLSKLAGLLSASAKIRFLIGPEGGFDEQELTAAAQSQIPVISLCEQVLRVETAAIAISSWALIQLQQVVHPRHPMDQA